MRAGEPVALVLLMSSVVWSQPSQRLALVIGIGGYDRLQRLPNANTDADTVSEALKKLGFEVTPLSEPTKSELLSGLGAFAAKIKAGDAVVVYYAGHGVQVNGVNYVIPIDYSIDAEDPTIGGVAFDRIIDEVGKALPKIKIFVFDACRDNPLGKGVTGLASMTGRAYSLGTYITLTTSPNQAALDGIFAKHFVPALQKPGLSVSDLFAEVRAAVAKETNGYQQPTSIDNQDGPFILTPIAAAQPARGILNPDAANGSARFTSLDPLRNSPPAEPTSAPKIVLDPSLPTGVRGQPKSGPVTAPNSGPRIEPNLQRNIVTYFDAEANRTNGQSGWTVSMSTTENAYVVTAPGKAHVALRFSGPGTKGTAQIYNEQDKAWHPVARDRDFQKMVDKINEARDFASKSVP
jgi:hypothetical protein